MENNAYHHYRHSILLFLALDVAFAFIAAILMLAAVRSFAAEPMTQYTDVPSGAWYEQSAANLLLTGTLDASETRLRPGEPATRAEVMKVLVQATDEDLVYPATASFSDVPRSAWYFP